MFHRIKPISFYFYLFFFTVVLRNFQNSVSRWDDGSLVHNVVPLGDKSGSDDVGMSFGCHGVDDGGREGELRGSALRVAGERPKRRNKSQPSSCWKMGKFFAQDQY